MHADPTILLKSEETPLDIYGIRRRRESREARRKKIDKASFCTGKAPYKTFSEADQTMKRRHHRFPYKVYRCRFCQMWHIGTDKSKEWK